MERLVQSARFYELLGYTLAVLAFSILGAGVIWSLRLHVSEKRRTFFLCSSLATWATLCGSILLWLVLSQQLSIQPSDLQRRQKLETRPVGESPAADVLTIEIDVDPKGTILFQGQEFAIDRLVAQLRRDNPNMRLNVTARIDAEASTAIVLSIVNQLNEQRVDHSLRVDH